MRGRGHLVLECRARTVLATEVEQAVLSDTPQYGHRVGAGLEQGWSRVGTGSKGARRLRVSSRCKVYTKAKEGNTF